MSRRQSEKRYGACAGDGCADIPSIRLGCEVQIKDSRGLRNGLYPSPADVINMKSQNT